MNYAIQKLEEERNKEFALQQSLLKQRDKVGAANPTFNTAKIRVCQERIVDYSEAIKILNGVPCVQEIICDHLYIKNIDHERKCIHCGELDSDE